MTEPDTAATEVDAQIIALHQSVDVDDPALCDEPIKRGLDLRCGSRQQATEIEQFQIRPSA